MDPLPRDIDDYIKQSIDHSLGLRVSSQTLEAKLLAYQDSQLRLQQQNISLLSKLNEKDKLIERAKCEASMNAQALKKFVEENQRLASQCESLLAQCHNLENECVLYDHDREALMEFGNDADKRACEAQSRVIELERDLLLLEDELKKYKHQNKMVNSSSECVIGEESILDSLLATVASEDDGSTYAFLKANDENESCEKLLTVWNCIKPSTWRVLSLVAKVKSLDIDKEHLRNNLHKAEVEVKLLFDENMMLDEENKRLLRLYKEREHSVSGGKHTSSASAKSNKRKSSHRTSSSLERKIDFDDQDSARQPLSPLGNNSQDCRMQKTTKFPGLLHQLTFPHNTNIKSLSYPFTITTIANFSLRPPFFTTNQTRPHFTLRFVSTSQQQQEQTQQTETEEPVEEFSKTRLLAQNVPWTTTPEDIRSLFEKHGKVLQVELSMYNKTRNRGLAFGEMGSPEEALEAMKNLESSEFEGRIIKLNYAKPKKKKTPPPAAAPKPEVLFNLFVANLSYEARSKDLKEFFDSGSGSGSVVSAEVIFHDNPRKSSGYGFVSFKSKKQADEALYEFEGKIFMGRPIRVARGNRFVKPSAEESAKSEDASSELSVNEAEPNVADKDASYELSANEAEADKSD